MNGKKDATGSTGWPVLIALFKIRMIMDKLFFVCEAREFLVHVLFIHIYTIGDEARLRANRSRISITFNKVKPLEQRRQTDCWHEVIWCIQVSKSK